MRRVLLVCLALGSLVGSVRSEEEPRLVARVRVAADGFHRISTEDLRRLGIPTPNHADVRRGGVPAPICRPGPKGELVFLASGTAGHHSRFAVYEIWRSRTPLIRTACSMDAMPGAPGGKDRDVTRVFKRDVVYGELGSAVTEIYTEPAPVWFLTVAPHGSRAGVMLDPRGADRESPQRLAAHVYVAYAGPVALHAFWGGSDLGVARVESAVGGALLNWTVEGSVVPKDTARLILKNVSPPLPPPPKHDVSAYRGHVYVESLTLIGKTVPPKTPKVRDVHPVAVEERADPLQLAGRARHVVIATPPLLAGARRLSAHRTKHGLPSAAIPVTDVYDLFGHGEHIPHAIRRFVEALQARKGAPLEYVLLAGDATFDRTDMLKEPTIPAWMTRTMYNGATASDRLYVKPRDSHTGGPSIGRLPFRKAETMAAYVERLIRYETAPPAHPTRRMLRFITSEGRFGALIDGFIENKFRSVLANDLAPGYDVEVTFASEKSPFLWPPPEFGEKVLAGLNEGALFYTYVGHGFRDGFDTLRVGGKHYPILHLRDAPRVAVEGTSPIAIVLACTTAMFDGPGGIGEQLLRRPDGPVAYWGATRVCHPIYNSFVGESMARLLARGGEFQRLGKILDSGRDAALTTDFGLVIGTFLKSWSGVEDLHVLMHEGAMMYALLGDPALKVALPKTDIEVEARVDEKAKEVVVAVRSKLPAGTEIHVSLELPRNRNAAKPERVADPSDPASFEIIRRNHAAMNDWAIDRKTSKLESGALETRFALPGGVDASGLVVKAWTIAEGDVHQGAAVLSK